MVKREIYEVLNKLKCSKLIFKAVVEKIHTFWERFKKMHKEDKTVFLKQLKRDCPKSMNKKFIWIISIIWPIF
jgi:hypothetical protein